MGQVIYIDLNKSVKIHGNDVFLSDVAEIHCEDKVILEKINNLMVLRVKQSDDFYVVKMIDIIKLVENKFNEKWQAVEVKPVGENKCLVEFDSKDSRNSCSSKNKCLDWIKSLFVCLLLFFGAGFSIMAFDNDISLENMFDEITLYFTGNDYLAKIIMAVSYSIGIFIGITVFYNHFNKHKFSNDPTPIEVQMNLYEDDVITALTDRIEGKQ